MNPIPHIRGQPSKPHTMAAPLHPNPQDHISVAPNPQGTGQLLVVRYSEIEKLSDGLQIPLERGMDMIADAFFVLANKPDVVGRFATRFQSERMVAAMRSFVASHDQARG